MLSPGAAQRVVIHLNEDAASEGDYLHLEIVSFLFEQGVSGATVLAWAFRVWDSSSHSYAWRAWRRRRAPSHSG